MKKPILIVGIRCSGKTTILEKKLEEFKGNYIHPLNFKDDLESVIINFKNNTNIKIDAIVYDGVNVNDLKYKIELCKKYDIQLFYTFQKELTELPYWMILECDVIECIYGRWEAPINDNNIVS